jgi:hypothetical protein
VLLKVGWVIQTGRHRQTSRHLGTNMLQVTPAVMKYIKYVDYIKVNGRVIEELEKYGLNQSRLITAITSRS